MLLDRCVALKLLLLLLLNRLNTCTASSQKQHYWEYTSGNGELGRKISTTHFHKATLTMELTPMAVTYQNRNG